MTVYSHVDAAIRAAQRDADAKQKPHAVVLWLQGSRHYHVRELAKAQSMVAKHPETNIIATRYPQGLFGGDAA